MPVWKLQSDPAIRRLLEKGAFFVFGRIGMFIFENMAKQKSGNFFSIDL
jgi:hypothetical protein